MTNILAISGSLREGSSNHSILNWLGRLTPSAVNYFIYNGLSEIPAFDPGIDDQEPPASVSLLREQIAQADAIIICTPEYAFGVPGALKNALDWTVSSGSFSGRITALITASTGGENGHVAMIKILGALDARLNPQTTMLIQFVRSKIDAEGNITDKQTSENLEGLLKFLLQAIDHR